MITEILGDFSDRLLAAYKEVLGAGRTVTETLDGLMWLLQQASRQYAPEIEILQGYGRLAALGVTERYEQGAQARLGLLSQLIAAGVAAGEFNDLASPDWWRPASARSCGPRCGTSPPSPRCAPATSTGTPYCPAPPRAAEPREPWSIFPRTVGWQHLA